MIRRLSAVAQILALAAGLALSVLHFLGRMDAAAFKTGFLAVSAVYFVFAALWAASRRKPS